MVPTHQPYDFDLQDSVRDLKISPVMCLLSQDVEQEQHQKTQLSQHFPIDNHTIYWNQAQEHIKEQKYQVEVTKRLVQYQNQLSRSTIPVNQSMVNESMTSNVSRVIIRKFDNPTQGLRKPQRKDKLAKAQEAMKMMIDNPQQDKTKMQEEPYQNVRITDKSTLFSMMPPRKNKTIPQTEPSLREPSSIKMPSEACRSFLRTTQEKELNEMKVLIQEVTVLGPLLVCQAVSDMNELVRFIYKPGFEEQMQRPNLYESALDFEYAEKPVEGYWYMMCYRTTNTQKQYMVEKLIKL